MGISRKPRSSLSEPEQEIMVVARSLIYRVVGLRWSHPCDADSFWVDGYFEETALKLIHDGDPAKIWLLGEREVLEGHVQGVARGIVLSIPCVKAPVLFGHQYDPWVW
jgi:hypothetical protein